MDEAFVLCDSASEEILFCTNAYIYRFLIYFEKFHRDYAHFQICLDCLDIVRNVYHAILVYRGIENIEFSTL